MLRTWLELKTHETKNSKKPAITENHLVWAANALPLSHDNRTTTSPHNPLCACVPSVGCTNLYKMTFAAVYKGYRNVGSPWQPCIKDTYSSTKTEVGLPSTTTPRQQWNSNFGAHKDSCLWKNGHCLMSPLFKALVSNFTIENGSCLSLWSHWHRHASKLWTWGIMATKE